MGEPKAVTVTDGTIRLGQFLKLADLADRGSDARLQIASGAVRVNGEVELRRGRQLRLGDVVSMGGESARVA